MNERHPPAWFTLLAATFAIGVSNSVVFAVLGDLQDRYGFGDAGLGWIAGSGFIVGFLAQLLIAPFADRGHSKRLLIVGLLAAVAGGVMFSLSSSLTMFIVARGILGLSNGMFLPAVRAIVASMSPIGVAERLGRLGGIELIGFVTGPVIGGALADPLGLRWPFVACSTAAAIAAVLLLPRTLPEPARSDRRAGPSLALLKLPDIRIGVLLSIGLFLPVGVYDSLWDRYLTDRGASNTLVGLSFLMYGIPFALFSAAGGRRSDRNGAVRMAVIAMVVSAPLIGLYGLISIPWVIIGVSVLEGGIQAFAVPAAQSAVAQAAPIGQASSAQGLAGSAQLLAAALASFTAPAMYGAYGPATVFIVTSITVLLVAAAVLATQRQRQRLRATPIDAAREVSSGLDP